DERGEVNEPIYFEQFVHQIEAHGLKHVAPASPSMEMLRWVSPAQLAKIKSFTNSELEREQYMDFMTGPTFRSSVICHAEAHVTPAQVGVDAANNEEDRVAARAVTKMFVAG